MREILKWERSKHVKKEERLELFYLEQKFLEVTSLNQ